MYKRSKVFAELPWTMDMPEHLGGDEADVVLHIEGEYIPECRGSRDRYGCSLEPDEPAHIEYDKITATSEAMYGPVQTIDVWDIVQNWSSATYDDFDQAAMEAAGLFDEPDY